MARSSSSALWIILFLLLNPVISHLYIYGMENSSWMTLLMTDTRKRGIGWGDLPSELLRGATPKQLNKISDRYEWIMSHVLTDLRTLVDGEGSLADGISVNLSCNLRRYSTCRHIESVCMYSRWSCGFYHHRLRIRRTRLAWSSFETWRRREPDQLAGRDCNKISKTVIISIREHESISQHALDTRSDWAL